MTNRFSPLLSAKVFAGKPEDTEKNLSLIKFPILASIKWDGWRMFEYGGEVRCRSMKPPKNKYVQGVMRDFFADLKSTTNLTGLDGEALAGDILSPNVMQASSSAFNSYEGAPDFTFQVFDSYQYAEEPFEARLGAVQEAVVRMERNWPWLKYTEHKLIHNMEELMEFLAKVERMGGEGVMGRSLNGRYKMGRSSMREGILWALKPYEDDECVILELHEELENQNVATINELGHTTRSGHKENLVPKGTFGKAICRSKKWKETFSVGAGVGLTAELRKYIWEHQDEFIGATLKYKYQAIGCVDRPRQPKWMGIRPAEDLPSTGDGPAIVNMKDA